MKTRKATKKDIDKIIELTLSMWQTHEGEASLFIDVSYITPEIAREYFLKFFESRQKAIFVAEDEGKIVGTMNVAIVKLERFFTHTKAAYLDDLVVDKDYYRQGIATKLNDACERFAKENGAKIIKARVYTFNEPSQSLLKKRGFYNLYSEYFKLLD